MKLSLLVFLITTFAFANQVKWYGQAAIKITTGAGKVILIDPFIKNNPKTPSADKDLSKIGKVDLILVTHGHADHVGDTYELVKSTGAKVAMNADMGKTMVQLGLVEGDKMIRFNKSGTVSPIGDGIKVSMVKAEHSSSFVYKDPSTGKELNQVGGEPSGYIIELEDGYKIYHAGDTGVFVDMQMIADIYSPDLALLPIGGHFTMGPKEAAIAVKKYLKTKTIVPIHYGTFPILKGTPEEFIKHLGDKSFNVIVMNPGDEKKFKK